ncbi:MAG: amidohydrolase [Halodesulfovibrio sp.]|uniref:amidohydrolase n=1 Tax=Halodesulfovibrio sp. TaxID=1912772 RepID=UPI00359EC7E4
MKTLYRNGTIVTMDPALPQAQALVTEKGRILGVGSTAAMLNLAGSESKTIDLEGAALFPGFNETHNHLSMYAIFRQYAYLGACMTIDELIQTLSDHAANTDAPIIVGYSYDDTLLTDNRQITCEDLNRVTTDKPVVVIHISAHLGFLDTRAMAQFSITKNTPCPEGGVIHKDSQGNPTGRLDETVWFNIVSKLETPDPETYLSLLEETVKEFNQRGITGVHDAGLGIEGMPDVVYDSYATLEAENRLPLRVFLSAMPDAFDTIQPAPLTEMGDTRVIIGGVKLFIDGSIQAETAALLSPYARHDDWKGELVMQVEEFEALVQKYHAAGHHISIHGNGDAAIETIISAIEKAQAASPQHDNRHMLIHSQMAHTGHLQRMRTCGIIPSFFCMHVYNWGDRHKELFVGPERAARMNPAGEAESMGLPFTMHVDTPVLPVQVLESIQTAVTRKTRDGHVLGAEQCTTQYGAVAAYTSHAALCSRSEKHRGTLTAGKLADMTLLSKDITTVPPAEIADTEVLMTIVGGEIVYMSDSSS